MPQSRIKDDVFSAGYFVEVVINTVGEAVKEAEREGESDKAGETEEKRARKTEIETAETFGRGSSSPSGKKSLS